MFLFNPDNDLALANFSPNYTPPISAVKIVADLAALPIWYVPNCSRVIADGLRNENYLQQLRKLFPFETSFVSFTDISSFPQEEIIPWGWNPALRKKLLDANVSEEKLPSIEKLKLLRDYSGRQHAVKMLRELKQTRSDFCGESHFFDNVTNLTDYLSTKINSVLKMPYSGSGKGLVWIKGGITDKQTDWCRRVIREQGGVIAEPVLKKVQDFAMEFIMEKGIVRFAGYSLFTSAASGAYMGNHLLSDSEIEKQLSQYVSIDTLNWVKSTYLQNLLRYFPHYNGYIGVDMMICGTNKNYRVQPCVEINMRMNMGVVARLFYDKFVHPYSSGKFVVDFFKKQSEALVFQQKMQKEFPLLIENKRIKTGFFNLTPISEETNYVAWVLIGKNKLELA
ncbi:MAG: hypothetical protein BWZ00_01209 [Bacteroidetes bacterium ADurb.BinA174]|nr:MAG: hypothetical protein BWZ00_01209 [Bacteroidetes bacterium ADurb.BinA174]